MPVPGIPCTHPWHVSCAYACRLLYSSLERVLRVRMQAPVSVPGTTAPHTCCPRCTHVPRSWPCGPCPSSGHQYADGPPYQAHGAYADEDESRCHAWHQWLMLGEGGVSSPQHIISSTVVLSISYHQQSLMVLACNGLTKLAVLV